MIYRYEFDYKCNLPHTGILCGLDDLFEEYSDRLFKVIGYFTDNLQCPSCYKKSNLPLVCYFTKKGKRKFNRAIKIIKKEVKPLGVKIVRLELDETIVDTIYYRDEYQVVIDKKYISKSDTKII